MWIIMVGGIVMNMVGGVMDVVGGVVDVVGGVVLSKDLQKQVILATSEICSGELWIQRWRA